jgi:AsmA protein
MSGIVALLYLTLPLLLRGSKLLPVLEARLSHDLGRRVRIGSLHHSPLFGSLIADDVSVADDPLFSSAPFLHAQRVELSVRRMALIFRREIEITGVSVEEPTITAIKNLGQWNYYAMLAAPTPSPEAAGPWVRIVRGILVVRGSDRDDPFVLRDLSFEAAHFSTAQDIPFAMTTSAEGGGTLKMDGRMGPLRWAGGAPFLPVNVLVSARKVGLAASNLTHSLAPGLGGQLSFDGSIESDESRVLINGNVDVAKLKLSLHGEAAKDPLRCVVAIEHNRVSGAGTVTRCDAMLPKGSASVTGTYDISGDTQIDLRVTGQGIPVTPIGGLAPAAGLPLPPGTSLQDGVAFLDLTVRGSLKGPTTKGSVTVENTRLMAFDLEERLSAVAGLDALHISRDLPINSLQASFEMTPEKATVTSLDVELPEIGTMNGSGTIDAKGMLEFQMTALRAGLADRRPIPFLVRGACVSPVFRQAGKTY